MSIEYTKADQETARGNIDRVVDYLSGANRLGLVSLVTTLQETAKDPDYHTPLSKDEIKTICRLAFCFLFQWLYPTPGDPMKIYRFIQGPKDGEEIKTTNAPHPHTLTFATDNSYAEYTVYTEEQQGQDTIITYSLTQLSARS